MRTIYIGGAVVCLTDATLEEKMTQIYSDTYDRVLHYVVRKCKNPSDIPDIMQNTYMKFYKRLKKCEDIKNPEHYLLKIAKGEVCGHYRTWYAEVKNVPLFSKDEEDDFGDIEKELQCELQGNDTEICDELWDTIKSGDPLTLRIFILYFEYDEKIDDISKILHVNPSTVKNRLYRTLKQVREKQDIGGKLYEFRTVV